MKHIEFEIIDKSTKIGLLTINRPEAKNALNRQLICELGQLIEKLEKENKVRVVILQGNENNFAAGADIKEMLNANIDEIDYLTKNVHELHKQMNQSSVIFIASIEGYCLGGGFELALASDIRISSPAAVFGLPEVKLGILPGGWGTQKILSLAGSSFAMKSILTGDFFSSEKALSVGLISDVVENPLEECKKLAGKIASNSPASIQAIKKLLTGIEYTLLAERFEEERKAFKQLFLQGEAREGLLAFTEKRKPNYQGA